MQWGQKTLWLCEAWCLCKMGSFVGFLFFSWSLMLSSYARDCRKWLVAAKANYNWITVKDISFISSLFFPCQSMPFFFSWKVTFWLWKNESKFSLWFSGTDFTLPRSRRVLVLALRLKSRSSWLFAKRTLMFCSSSHSDPSALGHA